MTASGRESLPTFGFLTVRQYADHGFIGGYLILNASARPLEFHCTAPVKATRPQEILYGRTLEPYLVGEVITPTLLAKAKSKPRFVCTDLVAALSAADDAGSPLVLINTEPATAADSNDRQLRLDWAHGGPAAPKTQLLKFGIGNYQAAVPPDHADDRDVVLQEWEPRRDDLDLHEPFVRLREAIDEAQRGAAR